MRAKENVIDLAGERQRREKNQTSKPKVARGRGQAPIVDMTERRAAIVDQERRKVRRTILTEFIGAHVVLPGHGLLKVTLADISDDGVAFDVEPKHGGFKMDEEVAMRMYLNHQTYFPFFVKIQNTRIHPETGLIRHGANFLKGAVNEEALGHFVRFIETVSASLRTDHGDVMVSNLTGD